MRRIPSYKPLMAAFMVLASLASGKVAGLDVSLNGETRFILDEETLRASARPLRDGSGLRALALESLYPYLDSVESLEATSEDGPGLWDAEDISSVGWEKILLVDAGEAWEIRVGNDVLANPGRISARGKSRQPDRVLIWSTRPPSSLDDGIESILALRSLGVDWKRTGSASLLGDLRAEGPPHLLLTDDATAMRLGNRLRASEPVMSIDSLWLKGEAPGELPFAVDPRNPEAPLPWLLADNPALFDPEGKIPSLLATLLEQAASASGEEFIGTEDPFGSLLAGECSAALILPSDPRRNEAAASGLEEVPPFAGAVDFRRIVLAAVPSGLEEDEALLAMRILDDIVGSFPPPEGPGGAGIPDDPRMPRYLDGYARIGRLAIAGQMDPSEAVEYLDRYIGNR